MVYDSGFRCIMVVKSRSGVATVPSVDSSTRVARAVGLRQAQPGRARDLSVQDDHRPRPEGSHPRGLGSEPCNKAGTEATPDCLVASESVARNWPLELQDVVVLGDPADRSRRAETPRGETARITEGLPAHVPRGRPSAVSRSLQVDCTPMRDRDLLVMSGTFDRILTYMGFGLGMFPILAVIGIFRLRNGDMKSSYRMPLYPRVLSAATSSLSCAKRKTGSSPSP